MNKGLNKTNEFKFSILTQNDTISVFNSHLNSDLDNNLVKLSIEQDSLVGLFEYREEKGKWKSVKHKFDSDTNGLKRIEINLYFSINNVQTEFLRDFTVDKYYKTNSVSIKSGKLKVGSQPVFMLINHSETIFYGASPTNHFYGTIKSKTENGWNDLTGSYCMSTDSEKPLTKSDTVYSWIPSYNPGDEFKLRRPGTYKYVVPMGLEKYSNGTPVKLIDKGETRIRTRTFVELETEFIIE